MKQKIKNHLLKKFTNYFELKQQNKKLKEDIEILLQAEETERKIMMMLDYDMRKLFEVALYQTIRTEIEEIQLTPTGIFLNNLNEQ